MSNNHPETENEQKQPLLSIHMQETIPDRAAFPAPSPPPSRPKNRRWLVVLISAAVVLLLAASAGAVVLTQLGRQPVNPTPTPKPSVTTAATTTPVPTATTLPTGQWVQSLTGYRVTSLAAAPSHSNVIYACVVPSGLPDTMAGVQTVLRSADFGAHWQDIGSRAQMSRGCELTINPTDSYEIYVATSSNPPTNPAVPSYVLEHTSNGGDSWETINPTVHASGLNADLAWQGTQLSFAGNRLYSLQYLSIPSMPTPQGHQGPLTTGWTRLLMSMDGGHTWGVLDTQVAATWQSAGPYAVNPANQTTLYELAILAVLPGTGFPPLDLYKSVDGGKTWQSVVRQIPNPGGLPFIKILTGSENPDVVYLTNTRCPAAQAFHAGNQAVFLPLAGSGYSLCMSSDGGKSWRTLSPPSQFAQTMGGGVVDPQGRLYTQVTVSGAVEIWRYDPTTDTWNKVTQAPREGNVLAGTPTGANGTTVLWLMSTTDQVVLYRYVIK